MENKCAKCDSNITRNIYTYSRANLGLPLCFKCQNWFKMYVQPSTTIEAVILYFELCKRGIEYAELEKWGGNKTIDIAIVNARLNIEIDGSHHNWNAIQAIADLRRTYFSLQKGYFTLRIPNSLIHNHLYETADIITSIIKGSQFLIQHFFDIFYIIFKLIKYAKTVRSMHPTHNNY